MKLITIRDEGFSWQNRGRIHAKGYLFDRSDIFCRGDGILDYFSPANDETYFRNRLLEANGAFAVIRETDSQVLAAVDRVRSMPLFYAMKGSDLVLGDDVFAIQNELGGGEIDPVSREEFMRVGYTVGPSTLDPRIKQIEAGDFLVFNKANARIQISTYFSHAYGELSDRPIDGLVEELDQITSRWARRLIHSAEGRSIVVPLSGGYDSRSIVCALKREGYPSVVCYSYGAASSYEHQTARQVAQELGYPIHVIEYNRNLWESVVESPRFRDFCNFVSQHSAVPCIQELPACEMLIESGTISPGSIIVPGYCGDLQGGSHIPVEVRDQKTDVLISEGIENYIFRTLFYLLESPITPETKQTIISKIRSYTSQFATSDIESFCSVNEDWFVRHRVAKFVINTVRTHEWFGCEWRLPLWDNELIEWWYRIPLRFRINSELYHRFLFERLFLPMNVAFKKPSQPVQIGDMVRRYLPSALIPLLRAIYRKTPDQMKPKPADIGAFDYAAEVLLGQCPPGWTMRDFGNINGVIALWYITHNV